MKLQRRLIGAAALAGALTVAMSSTAMAASDVNPSSTTTYVAAGSDTTDDVVGALAAALKDSSNNPYLTSYSAVGSSTITIPGRTGTVTGITNPNCTMTRPNGSGAGLNALGAGVLKIAAPGQTTGTAENCVQIARSSGSSNPGTGFNPTAGSLDYVPFAVDSVSYATIQASQVPHNLNLADLKAIYTDNGVPGTAQCGGSANKYQPLIPQLNSGTRKFWATALGISDSAIDTTKADSVASTNSWGSCVRDVVGSTPEATTGTSVQEHDGRVLSNKYQLVPFSTAQFIAQGAAVITDNRGGRTVLNAVDFDNGDGATSRSPFVLSTDFHAAVPANGNFTRNVFNVVEDARLQNDARLRTLLTSVLCTDATAKSIIQRYGFDLPASGQCGTTSQHNS